MTDELRSQHPQHHQAWDLIPWVVNGTATESERRSVEDHLRGCPDCRDELQFQHRLHRAIASADENTLEADARHTDGRSGWTRLREQLDAQCGALEAVGAAAAARDSSAPVAARPRHGMAAGRGWARWALAAMLIQGVGLGVLGTALWSRPASNASTPALGAYRTLSAPLPATPTATLRVVFAPTMTLAELQAVLARARLQVVSGPSDAGVWSLGPAADPTRAAADAAVRALRANPSVRFAEPIDAAP